MNQITLEEAREHLGELCEEAGQGKRVLFAHGSRVYAIVPFDPEVDPEWNDPQLEAAVLAAVEGPHYPLTLDALRERGEQSIANWKATAQ